MRTENSFFLYHISRKEDVTAGQREAYFLTVKVAFYRTVLLVSQHRHKEGKICTYKKSTCLENQH